MKAAIFEQQGKAIEVRNDIDIIEPRAGEVRVRVHYCGVCHSELSQVNGTFMTPEAPTILCHEGAGVVADQRWHQCVAFRWLNRVRGCSRLGG